VSAVVRACPVCAAVNSRPWFRKAALQLVRCGRCDMGFLDPLPAELRDDYYDGLGRPYYLSADKLAGDYARVRFERECALLRRFCPRGAILDVGCSTGAFLVQLRERFSTDYQLSGIEISAAALDYARQRGLQVYDDSLLHHDFGAQRFDAVTFWAVLEHLPEPAAFVRRATTLLGEGGCCLALVPNRRSLALRLLGPRYRYVLAQHVNYFSSDNLKRLFAETGLNVVASGGSHFNPLVLWQDAWKRADEFVSDAERAALLRQTTRLKEAPWLRPARAPLNGLEKLLASLGLADNIWIVGQKPG
jgi:2-polyprenyl-3-methyl-5-hydroxy-6-metoxy-1,4-benzoquinol methylase